MMKILRNNLKLPLIVLNNQLIKISHPRKNNNLILPLIPIKINLKTLIYKVSQSFLSQLLDLALQYEDGYIYRGQGYEPSTREGFGILTDQNENEVYSGFWHDNQYHGHGKLINFQAEQLEGNFDYRELNNIDNCWAGYEGEFQEGKMHGKGSLQLTNGEKFEGTFVDGMIEGDGVFYSLDGKEIQGKWQDGQLSQLYQ